VSVERENFNRWYKRPLGNLYADNDAGFPILLITLPLLERFLREKTGVYEDKLTPEFYREIERIFPALRTKNPWPGSGSETTAQRFWSVFRNGLCHQATLRELPDIFFAGLNNEAPDVRTDGLSFVVSPVKFSRRVIEEIEADFNMFLGKSSRRHSLPQIF
jgi:hypothetical protein